MWHVSLWLSAAHHISFLLYHFSVKYGFPFPTMRLLPQKSPSVTQRWVSQENAFRMSINPSSFYSKLFAHFFYSNWKQFQVLKIAKLEFKITVHSGLCAKCTKLWPLEGMVPKWVHCLFFVCPCFREDVFVTCKIVSFLCSSYQNFLLKNVIIFFFENQILKWRSFEKKKAVFDLLFTFFCQQGNTQKPSAHISLTSIHLFCSPLINFPYQIWKKKKKTLRTYHVWFLFGMIPGVDPFSRHYGAIKKK